ncbi:MAG: peptidylprolyl isomerase [Candidatus Gracilibacteria bacterium]|nr:peptidylprolyl isomerase [Candidatus Gracilibacteria bacterium]
MRLVPGSGDTIATLKTSMGDIKVLLYTNEAPETTKNFIELSKQGKYENVPFHRVIDDFMIQCGDFENKNGTGGYSYQGAGTVIPDEFSPVLKNIRGALSMANRGPNTGGSQFFIVQNKDGASWLDGKHAVFGFVFEGMEVVDKIAEAETDASDRPLSEILLKSVEITTL